MSSASAAWRVFLAGKPRTAQSSIWSMELRVAISKSNSLRLLADASIAKTGFAEAKRLSALSFIVDRGARQTRPGSG